MRYEAELRAIQAAERRQQREELQKLGVATKWTMTAEATGYRETQAIEKKIKENPALRDAWIKRQFQMELLDRDLPETATEEFTGRPETPVDQLA